MASGGTEVPRPESGAMAGGEARGGCGINLERGRGAARAGKDHKV